MFYCDIVFCVIFFGVKVFDIFFYYGFFEVFFGIVFDSFMNFIVLVFNFFFIFFECEFIFFVIKVGRIVGDEFDYFFIWIRYFIL